MVGRLVLLTALVPAWVPLLPPLPPLRLVPILVVLLARLLVVPLVEHLLLSLD